MPKDLIFKQADYALFLHRIRGHKQQKPNSPPVKKEHTFERDLILCQLHRSWGYDVPATDIDFLEYDERRPVALIEYKKRQDWQTAQVNKDANLTALVRLGNRAQIPVYVVFYSPDHAMFRVIAMNVYAEVRQTAFQLF